MNLTLKLKDFNLWLSAIQNTINLRKMIWWTLKMRKNIFRMINHTFRISQFRVVSWAKILSIQVLMLMSCTFKGLLKLLIKKFLKHYIIRWWQWFLKILKVIRRRYLIFFMFKVLSWEKKKIFQKLLSSIRCL